MAVCSLCTPFSQYQAEGLFEVKLVHEPLRQPKGMLMFFYASSPKFINFPSLREARRLSEISQVSALGATIHVLILFMHHTSYLTKNA